jgi:hypothetical protein
MMQKGRDDEGRRGGGKSEVGEGDEVQRGVEEGGEEVVELRCDSLASEHESRRRLRPLECSARSRSRSSMHREHAKLLAELERMATHLASRARRVASSGARALRAERRVGFLLVLMAGRHGVDGLLDGGEGERLVEACCTRAHGRSLRGGGRLEEGRGVLCLAEGEGVGALELALLHLVAEVVELDATLGETCRIIHLEVTANASLLWFCARRDGSAIS